MRYAVLGFPDWWWRREWARFRHVDALAVFYDVPRVDVAERLRAASIELRGRRPRRTVTVSREEAPRVRHVGRDERWGVPVTGIEYQIALPFA